MPRFVTFGETMARYSSRYVGCRKPKPSLLGIAGSESNVAVNLRKISPKSVEILWISRLGDDEAGRAIYQELSDKIRVLCPLVKGDKTGTYSIEDPRSGNSSKIYDRMGSSASKITFSSINPFLKGTDLLHVTGITPALSDTCKQTTTETLEKCRDLDIPISLDLNYRDQLWNSHDCGETIDRMIPYASLFKLGLDEAETIWGWDCPPHEYAKRLQDISGGIVLVTQGSSEAILFDGENLLSENSIDVDVKDPIGAGDAFVAGFIGAIFTAGHDIHTLKGLSTNVRAKILSRALKIANICGALTCTKLGDTAAMPTMKDVEEFMATST